MKQGTQERFEARKGRVTGSSVGAILGLDPYRNAGDVLRAMVRDYHGAESEFKGNIATQWVNANEDNARFDYELLTGNKVDECGFFPYEDWLGASPDGLVDHDTVVEFKCPFGKRKDSPVVFKPLLAQRHYYAQVQIEMLCAGRSKNHFYQWTPHGEDLACIRIDQRWLVCHLPMLRDFYSLYLSERDNKDHLRPKRKEYDTTTVRLLVNEYDEVCNALDLAKDRKAEILEELNELSGGQDALMCGRKLTRVEKKGSVSYAGIVKEKLPDLDVEKYRGKSSVSWRLM